MGIFKSPVYSEISIYVRLVRWILRENCVLFCLRNETTFRVELLTECIPWVDTFYWSGWLHSYEQYNFHDLWAIEYLSSIRNAIPWKYIYISWEQEKNEAVSIVYTRSVQNSTSHYCLKEKYRKCVPNKYTQCIR